MKNELTFKNHSRGLGVAKALLDEGNVVMLSYEEEFLVLNWEWCESGYADRSEVVFMPQWKFDEKYCEIVDEDEPQTNNDFTLTYTCNFSDCESFKNFGFNEKCIRCRRKQSEAMWKTNQTKREGE